MYTEPIQNITQAITYIQSLPVSRQQEMVAWIKAFQSQEVNTQSQSNIDAFYQSWQQWHKESQAFLDNDVSWADTRDKNDVGREVSFE